MRIRYLNDLDMKSLGECSDFYVKLDVTLLTDIMEELRNTIFKAYSLAPLHSYTAVGIAWQAILKETQCKLEFMTKSTYNVDDRIGCPWWDYTKNNKTCITS